jgi:hypothetical protein
MHFTISSTNMKAALLLRLALALAILELAGHTGLILTFVPKHGVEEAAVVAAMKAHEFSFSGSLHSYWDMYFGYELFVSASLVVEAGILWQLLRYEIPGMIGMLALGEVLYALLMARYFFIIPIVGHTTMALLLGGAWFASRRAADPGPSSPWAARRQESPAR